MIPPPTFGYRGKIPLYFPKSEEQYKRDPYEQYDTTVLRNLRNYMMSSFGDRSIEFLQEQIGDSNDARVIFEIGCGVGYHLMKVAEKFKLDSYFGFDTSYQMLKLAEELWIGSHEKAFTIPSSNQGHEEFTFDRKSLRNSVFAMSQGDILPVGDGLVDVVYSCFLWDRMPDIAAFVMEQKRILKEGGKMIVVSPLNYQKKSSWEEWYPVHQIVEKIEQHGFKLITQLDWTEKELMDKRGNGVEWSVTGMSFQKSETAFNE